ncbi:MAG: hypothetical protein IJP01_06205 [Oscillospiraceae bacterium]|nr:hypothetical protein [Oscillospiraceae bacterium]
MARAIVSYTSQNKKRQLFKQLPQRERKRNYLKLCCYLLFLAGLILGAALVRRPKNDLFRFLATAAQTQVVRCCKKGFFYTAATATAARALSLLFCTVMANSALGLPFVCANLLISGCGIGLVSGFFYKEFALRGLLLNAMLVAIPCVLYALALCERSANGLRLSINCFLAAFMHHSDAGIDRAETRFLASLPRCIVLLFLAGILQGLFYVLFGRFVI